MFVDCQGRLVGGLCRVVGRLLPVLRWPATAARPTKATRDTESPSPFSTMPNTRYHETSEHDRLLRETGSLTKWRAPRAIDLIHFDRLARGGMIAESRRAVSACARRTGAAPATFAAAAQSRKIDQATTNVTANRASNQPSLIHRLTIVGARRALSTRSPGFAPPACSDVTFDHWGCWRLTCCWRLHIRDR